MEVVLPVQTALDQNRASKRSREPLTVRGLCPGLRSFEVLVAMWRSLRTSKGSIGDRPRDAGLMNKTIPAKAASSLNWPALRVDEWTASRDTLHMWTQIVGKIRLTHAPMVNHWWQVTLYVSPRGLTTSAIPYEAGVFDIEFDFIEHRLHIRSSDGGARRIALEPKSVADFYAETMSALDELGIAVQIQARPNEVDPALPFADDHTHASYDPHAVHLFWRQLVSADRVMHEFRSHFIGKVSPVHFFWGAMDLACTRFSGRTAPKHPRRGTQLR